MSASLPPWIHVKFKKQETSSSLVGCKQWNYVIYPKGVSHRRTQAHTDSDCTVFNEY